MTAKRSLEEELAEARLAAAKAECERLRAAFVGADPDYAEAYRRMVAAEAECERLRGHLQWVADQPCDREPADGGEYERCDDPVLALCITEYCLSCYSRAALTPARPAAPEDGELATWIVGRWDDEVANRPVENVHRRTLDNTWRQVYRRVTGRELPRPPHCTPDRPAGKDGCQARECCPADDDGCPAWCGGDAMTYPDRPAEESADG